MAAHAVENEFLRDKSFGISAWPFMWLDHRRGGWRYVEWRHRLNDRLFARLARGWDVDVVHLTEPHYYQRCWDVVPENKPIVLTVHDLIPELIFGSDDVRRERAEVLSRANKVIAVSDYTKKRIQELYGTPDEKIKVVYHGWEPTAGQIDDPVFPGMKYLLYVGGRYEYKNFPWLAKALAPLLKDDRRMKLVCTGVPFSSQEMAMLNGLGIQESVIQKPIPDCQMCSLYAHALCFIYPSKMEGFGIPILDAFSASCPVVLSRSSCFPEIGGDAALYFEEGDEEGLRSQVRQLLKDDSLRSNMTERGRIRATSFSWNNASKEVADVYRSL